MKAPSVDAVRAVIEAAEKRDPRLAALLMLGALTGMRRGELCGLRWSDVDLERGDLDVSRFVIVVPGGLSEKSTKTDRSRPVALDEVGVALLVQYRARVDEWASKRGRLSPTMASCSRRTSMAPRRFDPTTSPASSSVCGTASV